MYLMYVDESGDCGMNNSPTRYFVLSGLVIHDIDWQVDLDQLILFRKKMLGKFKLHLRDEIHAAKFINNPGDLVRIPRSDRLTILRHFANEIATLPKLNIINIVVDKSTKSQNEDIFNIAWGALLQRFENTLQRQNFPDYRKDSIDEKGIVFPDMTDVKKLTLLLRKLRRWNPISNQPQFGYGYRNLPFTFTIEDPNFRNSVDSYFIQAADLTAFLLYQKLCPNQYMKKKQGNNYFSILDPVLCKFASRTDPNGIVFI